MKKHLRRIIKSLEALGCKVTADTTRRHYRLELQIGDRKGAITVSGTPQNDDDAVNLAVQQARRELGLIDAVKERQVRQARAFRRIVMSKAGTIALPAPIAPVRQDPRAVLENHPLYGAVLEKRLQRAFDDLWADTCMELFGTYSVRASVAARRRDW